MCDHYSPYLSRLQRPTWALMVSGASLVEVPLRVEKDGPCLLRGDGKSRLIE